MTVSFVVITSVCGNSIGTTSHHPPLTHPFSRPPPPFPVPPSSHQLMRLITEVEEAGGEGSRALDPKLKEKLALFKVTAGAMVKVHTYHIIMQFVSIHFNLKQFISIYFESSHDMSGFCSRLRRSLFCRHRTRTGGGPGRCSMSTPSDCSCRKTWRNSPQRCTGSRQKLDGPSPKRGKGETRESFIIDRDLQYWRKAH